LKRKAFALASIRTRTLHESAPHVTTTLIGSLGRSAPALWGALLPAAFRLGTPSILSEAPWCAMKLLSALGEHPRLSTMSRTVRRVQSWVTPMPITSRIVAGYLAALFLPASHAGEPPPKELLEPTPLPSLDQRIRDAELIVRVSVETKHRVIVYRVLETLKGTYDPRDYPDQYKGYFTDYTPARDYQPKHSEEIWFLSKSQILYAPDQHQNDPVAITGYAAKAYRDSLHLPVQAGSIAFPTVERPYRHEVLETTPYKRDAFIAAIRSTLKP
jgi:hypothetical protein